MKCEIIKDLLPSYIDGLTSAESNTEIEEHIKTCPECKEILEQMKTDVVVENIAMNNEKIKPFKKLNKRVLKSVLITLTVCILAVSAYLYFFTFGWMVNSEDVKITYACENDSIQIYFELTDGKVLNPWPDHRAIEHHNIKFTECYSSVLDDVGPDFSTGFGCLDENGKVETIYKDYSITLHFKDKTETLYLKDIVEELGLEWSDTK